MSYATLRTLVHIDTADTPYWQRRPQNPQLKLIMHDWWAGAGMHKLDKEFLNVHDFININSF
jgi:hypothetical protein